MWRRRVPQRQGNGAAALTDHALTRVGGLTYSVGRGRADRCPRSFRYTVATSSQWHMCIRQSEFESTTAAWARVRSSWLSSASVLVQYPDVGGVVQPEISGVHPTPFLDQTARYRTSTRSLTCRALLCLARSRSVRLPLTGRVQLRFPGVTETRVGLTARITWSRCIAKTLIKICSSEGMGHRAQTGPGTWDAIPVRISVLQCLL